MQVIRSTFLHSLIVCLGMVCSVAAHAAPPAFSMAFSPTTVGPGSTSTLTYTIDNGATASGLTGLSFTNTLPAGMTVAAPSRASTNCVNGIFSATSGGNTITFSDYRISGSDACTFSLDVTSSTAGTHVNTSGALASSDGSAGTANASLTVDPGRPGITVAFSPSTINQGAVSSLVYTIDNATNGSNVDFLIFTDTLPAGLVIADQPEASLTCTGGILTPEFTAIAGDTSIAIERSFTAAGASCTFSVDVAAADSGEYIHESTSLSQNGSNASGASRALLTVINPFLNANFPASVAPGTSATLRFTLNNIDRDNRATDITFTNDLNATLSGLTATVLPADGFCGSGSTLTGSANITVAGANLAVGASCTFDITVLVPSNAATGDYSNTTSIVNLTLGSATTRPALSHSLVVRKSPILEMAFIDDPVSAGGQVTLRFTITNSDDTNALSDLAFTQEIDVAYAGMQLTTLPSANSCGAGSTFTSTITDNTRFFNVTGGALAAGASCTFDALLTLPAGGSSGSFLYTSSAITGTLSGSPLTGNRASDTLTVIAGPRLTFDIMDDYIVPGGTATAELTLDYSENASADITDLSFTIDLDAALSGMTFSSVSSSDICGTGSVLSGTSTLTFAAGSLAAGTQCSFTVTLQIPSGAVPGVYTASSSNLTGTTAAQSASSASVSDVFTVSGLTFTKEFLSSPVLPGDTVVARYTISNAASSLSATAIEFTDRLSQALSSLSATGLPSTPCGVSSTITGATTLTFSGGEVAPGASCTFDVSILVPSGAAAGVYNSATTDISATVNSVNTANPSATAALYVDTLVTQISANVAGPTDTSPIPVTINFSRSVVNFELSDLVITNGVASNFSGSGQSYSIEVTPSAAGTVIISLPINAVDDALDNSVKNAATSVSVEFTDAPSNVAVTVPATALNVLGEAYTIEGTHSINGSSVFLFGDINNDGVADNTTVLASAVVANNRWSMATTLTLQTTNNYVVVWQDRVNRVERAVNVPTITEVTPNFDPTISGTPATSVAEDANYSFTPTVTDANTNDTQTFSITNQPSWASFSTVTGALTGTPVNADVGTTSNIVITVTDSASASASLAAFNLMVTNINDAPVISGTPSSTIAEDASYSFTPTVSDEDSGDTRTFSITNQPSWTSFSTVTGALTGIPSNDDVGTSSAIVITVSDTANDSDSLPAFTITVSNTNDTPTISGAPSNNVAEDAAYSFTPTANDVDSGDTLSFSIVNQPSWASFSTSTGALTGTPTNSDVGLTTAIVITVTDASNDSASLAAFSISVSNTNDALVISGTPSVAVNQDVAYNFMPTVSDVDVGDTTTFTITNKPSWASFDTDTGALNGTPGNSDVGVSSNIVISVTDSGGAISSLAAFDITVANVNDAPVISGTPATTVSEGAGYSFIPSGSDVDVGDTITFSIVNRPTWASFNTVSGALTGTPDSSDIGVSAAITITVSDSAGSTASLAAFTISVNNVNDAPMISGTPETSVTEAELYSFTPTVSDADSGESQTFSILNQPSWTTFDTSTGALTGTPTLEDAGIYGGIIITVTDSANATDSLAIFSITVRAINRPPVISGTPSELAPEDATYSFIPTVVDPDDADIRVFSILNQPGWSSFNSSNGALTGVPDDEDVGTTTGIVITVTDIAGESDSLPAFDITVTNVNDAPNAVDDNFVLSKNVDGYLLDVLQNDTDDEGDALTILSFRTSIGTLSVENGLLRFIPGADIETVEFEYLIGDGNDGQDSAIVSLTIENESTRVTGPEVIVPEDIEVNATGLFTRVSLGVATARDAQGNALPVSVLDRTTQFTSGTHKVYWQTTDLSGNSTVREQEVRVNPLVSFTRGQQVIEASRVRVRVVLSGESPEYPVVVGYSVSGTADGGDHNLTDGELMLTSAQGEILFDVFADGVQEDTETIILSLSEDVNQGGQNTHTINIVDGNVAPQVKLQVTQDGEPRTLIDQEGGVVLVTATVADLNPSDNHAFVWQFTGGTEDLDDSDNSFSFDPTALIADQYAISVRVTDDGSPSEEVSTTVYVELTNAIPVLADADSDDDLIPDNIEGFADDDADGIVNYRDNNAFASNVLPSYVDIQDRYLIEGLADVRLRKGRFSTLNERSGGVLSEADVETQIAIDADTIHIGEIFDFIIDQLPVVGQSYPIVLPQQQAIPALALYRKYLGEEWVNFTVDDRNHIYSTEGEPGYCPPPQASIWQLGLIEGHWCVQLSIEDGGPNDDDGLANGVIVDPGTVAVPLSDNNFPIVTDDRVVIDSVSAMTPVDIDVLRNDSDADGDTLNISSATANLGNVSISANGELIYTAPTGFLGEDSITYSISDGNGGTARGTLIVDVAEASAPRNVSSGGGGGGGALGWLSLFCVCLLCIRERLIRHWVHSRKNRN